MMGYREGGIIDVSDKTRSSREQGTEELSSE